MVMTIYKTIIIEPDCFVEGNEWSLGGPLASVHTLKQQSLNHFCQCLRTWDMLLFLSSFLTDRACAPKLESLMVTKAIALLKIGQPSSKFAKCRDSDKLCWRRDLHLRQNQSFCFHPCLVNPPDPFFLRSPRGGHLPKKFGRRCLLWLAGSWQETGGNLLLKKP